MYCFSRRYRVARLRPRRSAAACTSPRQMVSAAMMAPSPVSVIAVAGLSCGSECSSERERSSADSTEDLPV